MPANDDNPRNARHANHAPDALNGSGATITEHDLLGIVEGTINRHRLEAIRDTLAADKQLLATLARMKRDRETLQTAEHEHAETHAPPTLVHDALARAAATTLGFDDLAQIDAIPHWPNDPASRMDTNAADSHAARHTIAGRISPSALGHPRRFGWKARAALAASVLLVIAGAITFTAMLGALDADERPAIPQRPPIALADADQRDNTINQEFIDDFDAQLLRRDQLAEELMRLVDRSAIDTPPLDGINLDEILKSDQSIDDMLAQIAEELIESGTLASAAPTLEEGTNPVRRLIDTSGISVAAIGGLARAGRLHVSLEAGDPTRAAVALLTPDATARFTAELIDFADMDSDDWTGATPIARSTPRGTLASPPPNDPQHKAPEDPQLARVHQLFREIREREERASIQGERTDPVYRVTIAGLGRLNDESAGLEVITALERLVSAGDRVAFYELSGAEPAGPGSAVQAGPGFTLQMYLRERGRDR